LRQIQMQKVLFSLRRCIKILRVSEKTLSMLKTVGPIIAADSDAESAFFAPKVYQDTPSERENAFCAED